MFLKSSPNEAKIACLPLATPSPNNKLSLPIEKSWERKELASTSREDGDDKKPFLPSGRRPARSPSRGTTSGVGVDISTDVEDAAEEAPDGRRRAKTPTVTCDARASLLWRRGCPTRTC